MARILIFGTGDFAEVVHFYLTHDSPHEVVGFTVHESFLKEKTFLGLPVIPFENIEKNFPPNEFEMFVAVGYLNMNKTRTEICNVAKEKGFKLITYVNSKVTYWEKLKIGDNCFIFENVVIQPFVSIGNNVIMWSGNHIGHHSTIGDNCFITSHVVISGRVSVGSNCFLGVNSTIRDGVKIGKECVIGAGVTILKNVYDKQVYTTNEAKLIPKTSDQLSGL